MTAISYTDWASMSADQQKNSPGISVERDHPINNHDRGAYWSPATAASALSHHVEDVLTGDDRVAARRMWNNIKVLHRQATESPRSIDRAMQTRQSDAHAALGAYNGDLDYAQLEQLSSVMDDVSKLQVEAEVLGIDPIEASRRMLNRAASRAVGYDIDDNRIEAEMRPLIDSPTGSATISNLNQSVGQLQMLIKDLPLDALDNVQHIGVDTSYTEELQDDHRRLNDILSSIPLILNPQEIQPETNFSVRMETQEEATVMETVVRNLGPLDRMPTQRDMHRMFGSWRDNGLADSPYSLDTEKALGIVVAGTDAARDNLETLIGGLNQNDKSANSPVIVLTIDANDGLRQMLAATGRPVIDVNAEADAAGVHLSSQGQDLPSNRIELVNLTLDQASDPVERSLAVNAVVGRSEAIGYLAGGRMSPVEAQAIHLAGTLRKLGVGMDESGKSMSFDRLRELRKEAREVDAAADPQRYYTAGQERPHRGVNTVAFESATKFDMANKRNAPGRDIIGEAYDSIPKNSTILTVENKDNAVNKWLLANSKRPVLYAEATRSLSFAEIVGAGLDGERRVARKAEMELAIYDRPADEREYGYQSFASRTGENPNVQEYRMKETAQPENTAGVRRICLTKPLEWDDPKLREAIIFVSGNAAASAINTSSQAIKVAQEAVMDKSHSAIVLSDMTPTRESTDIHAAHMIKLAKEMGKKATVFDGRGVEVTLEAAREMTRGRAETYTEKQARELGDQMTASNPMERGRNALIDVAAKDDVGQLALAALPGMDAARAIRFGHTDVTLKEIREDKSEDMQKHLYSLGMPAETRKVINDIKPWTNAMDRALANMKSASEMGAQLHVPTDVSHPIELASGDPVRHAVFTIGGYDFEKQPVAAFIGSSTPYREAGVSMSLSDAEKAGPGAGGGTMIDPAKAVDRPMLRRTIEEMTTKGYGIGVTLEEGVSRAVLEEAAHVPDAKLVVMAPGNFQAASPELRMAVKTLFEQDRAVVVMPTNIAPHAASDPKAGEERKPDTYSEDRTVMQEMLAKTAKVGIVVASSDRDQALHVVRHLVQQDKAVAAMTPQQPEMAGSDLYSGNMRMIGGKAKTSIQSLNLAQATSAQAYAEINDVETAMVLEDGVRRGNAGTFQSARLSRSDMMRSGNSYSEFGWNSPAHAISTVESIGRFVEKAEMGEGRLGVYKEPTERELEAIRLKREDVSRNRNDDRVSMFTAQEFGNTSSLHRGSVNADSVRQIEEMGMDERMYEQRAGERSAARQAAAAGQSMG